MEFSRMSNGLSSKNNINDTMNFAHPNDILPP